MIKELSSMMSLLGNKSKIQDEMAKFQQAVGQLTAEGTAGAGYVTVKVNGQMSVLSVRISDEAMALNDHEMLEDLIVAATNQAFSRVRDLIASETSKMTASLGLPAGMLGGMGLPGVG
ncbi:YbaB/EbfC family nucleoid-associated protein [soil metagenome]